MKPDYGLVRKQHKDDPLWKVVLQVLALVGFFFVLFWNLYAYGRFDPVGVDFKRQLPVLIAGAIALGGGMIAFMVWEQRREQRRLRQAFEASVASGEAVEVGGSIFAQTGVMGVVWKVVAAAGALLLGGLTTLCWAYTANALLDTSPATERAVKIEELQEVTYAFLFRNYEVKYSFTDSTETRTRLSTPLELLPLLDAEDAVAEVRGGRLGWPWVERIRPRDLDA